MPGQPDPIMNIQGDIPGLGLATKLASQAFSQIPIVGPEIGSFVKGMANSAPSRVAQADYNDAPVGRTVGSEGGNPVVDAQSWDVPAGGAADAAGAAGAEAGLGDAAMAAAFI